jgi:ribosomal protein L9
MNERNLRVLEFPKIREMMAALAVTEMGREACRELVPSSDPDEVRRRQAETEEASTVLAYNGGNPMAWFTDVREFLKLAHVGSTLAPKALLSIADALKANAGITLDKRKIVVSEPIKNVGTYTVQCKLGYEITAPLTVKIEEM